MKDARQNAMTICTSHEYSVLCASCQNNLENKAARQVAVELTLERNPNGFKPMIAGSPLQNQENKNKAKDAVMATKYQKGCHCKRSECLKRYCECFHANILCSENCKCVDCKNSDKFKERSSQEFKKKTEQENILDSKSEEPQIVRLSQYQKIVSSMTLGSSKVVYRSLLAGIIQQQDMRDLCSTLVVISEAATILADKNSSLHAQIMTENQNVTSSNAEDGEDCCKGFEVQKTMLNDQPSGDQVDICGEDDPISGEAETEKRRPMSPGTLALMCDEKDMFFMPDASSDGILNHGCNSNVYVEQERLVLAKFCDCLHTLITHGNIKEAIRQETTGTGFIKDHGPGNVGR
ncbi:unnamed protein product [Ilex paraguariensis]|uniref:CRC domain-containing protein n=1 Tax=Ilex paraguariensis TaxID=185542 RepID=A0ABC8TYL2_9AQUA